MNTLAIETDIPKAENVKLTDDTLSVDLNDGRTISVPLEWFPRLVHATVEERNNRRLIGKGHGIHWEDIDEDITAEIRRDDRNRPRNSERFLQCSE